MPRRRLVTADHSANVIVQRLGDPDTLLSARDEASTYSAVEQRLFHWAREATISDRPPFVCPGPRGTYSFQTSANTSAQGLIAGMSESLPLCVSLTESCSGIAAVSNGRPSITKRKLSLGVTSLQLSTMTSPFFECRGEVASIP